MSEFNYNRDYSVNRNGSSTGVVSSTASIYRDMFGWMTAGLSLTGITSYVVIDRMMSSEAFFNLMYSSPMRWGLVIATVLLVMGLSAGLQRLSFTSASAIFAIYSVLNGAWISPFLLLFTGSSVTQVFFITAGTFGGMALYGHFTKADLSKIGQICIMALWGIILASLVNIFFRSPMTSYVISYIAIAVFCGLTMYDVQRFKNLILSYEGEANDNLRKIALIGALELYMDFINLFIYLLNILGKRK